jgi:hypothetical protein
MTDAEFKDFVTEMFWKVNEGGSRELRYVDGAVIDACANQEIQHGPWHPRDCSRVLYRWLHAGLINVCLSECWPPHPPPAMPLDRAERLLDDPDTWEAEAESAEKADLCISVWPADWGSGHSVWDRLDEWSRRIDRTLFDDGPATSK